MPASYTGYDKYFKVRSLIYARDVSLATQMLPLGLCDTADVKFTETVDRLRDVRRPGGGSASVHREIESGELTLGMREFSPPNMLMGLLATSSAVVAGSQAATDIELRPGEFTPTAHQDISSVVLTNAAGTTTYVAGTDYDVVEGGIWVRPGGAISAPETGKIAYSYGAQTLIEAIMHGGKTYELFFSALNVVDNDAPVTTNIWRARFGPMDTLALQGGQEHNLMTLKAEILRDSSKGAGVSQWMRMRLRTPT
jgi:hypothetical protein